MNIQGAHLEGIGGTLGHSGRYESQLGRVTYETGELEVTGVSVTTASVPINFKSG